MDLRFNLSNQHEVTGLFTPPLFRELFELLGRTNISRIELKKLKGIPELNNGCAIPSLQVLYLAGTMTFKRAVSSWELRGVNNDKADSLINRRPSNHSWLSFSRSLPFKNSISKVTSLGVIQPPTKCRNSTQSLFISAILIYARSSPTSSKQAYSSSPIADQRKRER